MKHHFIANKNITDIGGNIISFDILLNLNKLEYFGLTIQNHKNLTEKEKNKRNEKEMELDVIRKNLLDEKKILLKE